MEPLLQELHLRTLLAQTAVGVAATDADGRMTLLSPALEELFGQRFEPVSEEEIPDRFGLFCADGDTALRPEELPLARARLGETVRDLVVVSRLPDGRVVHLRCNAAPLRDDSGAIQGAIVLAQDITAERAAREEQQQLRDRLLSTVNHELRTPVTTLLGNVELLHDLSDELPPRLRRLVDPMLTAGGALRELLATISDLVDLEGYAALERRYADVVPLVGEATARAAQRGAGRGVRVEIEAPASARVSVDAAKVQRALGALLCNAVDHAPDGSVVLVRVGGDDDTLRIEVVDHGVGIPAADRERLVQPFERGAGTDPAAGGRGLGLAIARTVALAHGGELLLEDHHPHGLVAVLALPRVGSVAVTPRHRG
ncbi:ATP-binding protein [Nocardioides ferulae]|uniref:sensor histidine kinase n=1 Tax=Nocardioides ferulae TaxID=2340821 RepID=UPI000EB4AEB2|nr:ATP-binding protein [Nocardioides ferulae]